MNIKRQIAIICFKYPPRYSGYGQQLKSVLLKVNKINPKFQVVLLTAYSDSKIEENTLLRIIPLGSKKEISEKYNFYIFCLNLFFWLVKNRNEYQIIHCIKAGPEAIIANTISKYFKKRLIVKIAQDELSDNELNGLKGIKYCMRKFRHYLLKNVDKYIAISEEIEKNLICKVSSSTEIIRLPNGVDIITNYPLTNIDDMVFLRNFLGLPQADIILLFVGAINKRKGVFDLLNALDKIDICPVSVSLIICGPLLEKIDFFKLVDKIKQKQNNIQITYKGKVNNVTQYMQAADIFILPSHSEGLPNVLLEAAACGLGLIATDIGGNRDVVIDRETGILVSTNDNDSLKEKIISLIENKYYRKKLGSNARMRIEEIFSIEKIAEKYIEIYESMLDN